MPGVKSVNWTTDNEAKMLRALLVHADVKCDDAMAEKIAAEIGDGCTGNAIIGKIRVVRRKATKAGAVLFTPAATTKKRLAQPSSLAARKKAFTTLTAMIDEETDSNAEDTLAAVPEASQQGQTDGAHDAKVKKRASSRKPVPSLKKREMSSASAKAEEASDDERVVVKKEQVSGDESAGWEYAG